MVTVVGDHRPFEEQQIFTVFMDVHFPLKLYSQYHTMTNYVLVNKFKPNQSKEPIVWSLEDWLN